MLTNYKILADRPEVSVVESITLKQYLLVTAISAVLGGLGEWGYLNFDFLQNFLSDLSTLMNYSDIGFPQRVTGAWDFSKDLIASPKIPLKGISIGTMTPSLGGLLLLGGSYGKAKITNFINRPVKVKRTAEPVLKQTMWQKPVARHQAEAGSERIVLSGKVVAEEVPVVIDHAPQATLVSKAKQQAKSENGSNRFTKWLAIAATFFTKRNDTGMPIKLGIFKLGSPFTFKYPGEFCITIDDKGQQSKRNLQVISVRIIGEKIVAMSINPNNLMKAPILIDKENGNEIALFLEEGEIALTYDPKTKKFTCELIKGEAAAVFIIQKPILAESALVEGIVGYSDGEPIVGICDDKAELVSLDGFPVDEIIDDIAGNAVGDLSIYQKAVFSILVEYDLVCY